MTIDDREIHWNRRRAVVLAVGAGVAPGLVLGVVLTLVAGPVAGAVGLVAGTALVALALWRTSTTAALHVLGARPLPADDGARMTNMLEGLCATFGLRLPRVMMVEDPRPNACALGRTPHDAVLVITSGLLDQLDLIELEGVVAHELAHLKRHDTVVSGVAVTVLLPLARLSGDDRWLHAALGRGREYRVDQVAVAAVRYPPGLHDALVALVSSPAPGAGSIFEQRRLAATRWLWVDPLIGLSSSRSDQGGIDDIEVRIAALDES